MNLYDKLNYKLVPYIFNHSFDISKADEIVFIRGYLVSSRLLYNQFYDGYEIVQLDSNLSPDKNLYFTTISSNNTSQNFRITPNGKIIFISNNKFINNTKIKINLTGIVYSLAYGSRISLINKWLPCSTCDRSPSIYRVNNLVFMSGTMINNENDNSIDNMIFTVIPQYCIPKYSNKYVVFNGRDNCTISINNKGYAKVHNYNSEFISLDGIYYITHDGLPLMKNITNSDQLSILVSLNNKFIKNKTYFQMDVIRFGIYQINVISGIVKLNIISLIGWNLIGSIPIKYSPNDDLLFSLHCNNTKVPLKIARNGNIMVYICRPDIFNEAILNITNVIYTKP